MTTLHEECPPTWAAGADVLIVGEAPGADEVRQGEGFVGASGRLLDKMLLAAGLQREGVSLCNVVRRRPPNNDFQAEFYHTVTAGKKKRKVLTEEASLWIAKLRADLVQHPHRVIVAYGNEALDALIGKREIAKRRGSAYRLEDGTWVVAALHPAALLRGAQWQEVVMGVQTLQRVRELSQDPGWAAPVWNVQVGGVEEMRAALQQCMDAPRWALDLETIPATEAKAGVISVLGVAWEAEDGTVASQILPWPDTTIWPILHTAICRNGAEMAGHNLLYDQAWLRQVHAWPGGTLVPFDTMQRWHQLFPELPKGIDWCAAWALGKEMPYWKDEGRKLHKKKRTDEEQLRYWEYCAKDCVAALWLSRWIEQEEQKRKYQPQPWIESNWLVAAEMQQRGLPLDAVQLEGVAEAVGQAEEAVRQTIEELEPQLNPASSQAVMRVLYDKYKLPVQINKGKRTADEEALRQLQIKHPTPLVAALLQFRKINQLQKMFITPLRLSAKRGKLQCGWTCDATETFRFTSSTHPTGGGLNAQTVPKSLRHLMVAPEGRVFVQPDLSQAEARYVAYRSNNQDLKDIFENPNRHVHMEQAERIYGHSVEKDSRDYRTAKSTVHAANYREGPKRLSLQLSIPIAEAKQLLKRAQHQDILRWHEEVKQLMTKQGKLTNCWGQERGCYSALGMALATGQLGDAEWKEGIAWEPQSAIPQIINQAIWRIKHVDTKGEVWFHAHGHDSFLASIPTVRYPELVPLMLQALGHAIMLQNGNTFKIPAEMEIGWNWGQMVPFGPQWEGRWSQKYLASPEPSLVVARALDSVAAYLDSGGE